MGEPLQLLPVDRHQLDECWGWPIRAEAPTALEYTAAELYIRQLYKNHFQQKPKPQIVTWQYERFFTGYETGDPVIEVVMETLEQDFRNVFSNSLVKRYWKAVRDRKPIAFLRQLLLEAAAGGARKPDMLGIHADGSRLVFDAVEVGTEKTAKSTYDELQEKLAQLRNPVLPILRLKLELLAHRHYARGENIAVPQDFTIAGSAFRPQDHQWVLPLPIRISTSGSVRYADWICFHPSKGWRPGVGYPLATSLPGADQRRGTDGLLIYYIHRALLPNLPDRVARDVRQQLGRWRYEQGLTLELNPALAMSLKKSQSDWSPEALQLFAVLGVGAAIILLVLAAWEVGLVAGGAAVAEAGLVALSEAPLLLFNAIRSAALLATQLNPAAFGMLPFVPVGMRPLLR